MQLKIFKRSTLIIGLIALAALVSITVLMLTREKWADYQFTVFAVFTIIILAATLLYADYDLHYSQRKVKKMVLDGQIALAKINSGVVERMIRDARMRSYVLWKLDMTVYDQDMQAHKTQCIEKFALEQDSIPSGNVYVTYDPSKPEEIFIIPNAMIQAIEEFAPLARQYEEKLKVSYLNCYYRYGLVLKTYRQSMKEEQ